jgi:hypothetical protein
MGTEHPSIARVRRELERHGATGEIRVFSKPVRTAAAGHPDAVFSTTYDELAQISAAGPLDLD